MNRRFLNRRSLVAGLFIIGLTISGWLLAEKSSHEVASAASPDSFGVISGLSSGDPVSYQIMSDINNVVAGKEFADDDGQFKIPLFKSENDKDISYNLEITKKGKPLNLNFHVLSGKKGIKISGQGIQKFSDIKIQGLKEEIETKSDWSGAFDLGQVNVFEELENLESFRVALFNNNVLSDVQENNPLIIEVIETAGGGGPTSDGVNEWDLPSYCGGGPLSICLRGATNRQIRTVVNKWVGSLMVMTEQLSAVMMQYTEIIGTFFDAKMQLETQRQIQAMQAQAHKDYHPSEQMCVFGSFVKSVATVEEKARYERRAFNKIMMERYVNADYPEGYQGSFIDVESRLRQFRTTYCDPNDHNNGLEFLCQHDPANPEITNGELIGGQEPERINRDIDYVRLMDYPLTLNVDFLEGEIFSPEEEDIIALARNLYWPKTFRIALEHRLAANPLQLMNARRLMAMQNVGHNSFSHIMGMKARAPEGLADQSGWSFMKAFMRDFGLSDTEIVETLGERPSYYAQMEVLTKKLYQNPDFYTNLYDKPVNVNRISASMEAIKLMQMRDWFQAATRREMLSSLLVEEGLIKHVDALNDGIATISSGP